MQKNLMGVLALLLALSVSAFQNDNNLIGRWHWQQTQESSGDLTTPLDPTRYTIEFMADGRVTVQSDCNQGAGNYTANANTLDIGELVTTKMACPSGSLNMEFLRQLDEVNSFLFKDGNLYLELPVDTGSMEFVRADQPSPAAPTANGQAYTVQAEDWLSKIAEKTYNDPLAYAAIVAATNELAAQVSTFKPITDPNVVEVGQQLWLPDSKFVGVYRATLPAASSPGREMSLTLRLDGTAELSSDYLNGEAPIVETGTWQDNNDGAATVSLTGQAGGVVYEAPVVITFRLDGSILTAVAYDQTLYGSEGITLERQIVAPPAGQAENGVGIYKALLPAASSPGIDSTLYLNVDNTVRLVEDYLNGEPAIVEVGNWRIEGEQVIVTISGQENQPYDAPNTVTFNLTGNILATTPDEDLYGSAGRRYLRFEALATGEQPVPYDAAAAEKLMTEAGLAGMYKGFSPAASCCGLDWTLFLNPDNSASLKSDYLNGEAPILENGTWQVADNILTVTLAGAEKPMTFQVADGTLVSNEFSIFGQMPLRLYRFEIAAQSPN
ncbi:MAG: copper resistance protein NlpE N-terminal domain-containing protein [Anaerolineales bacterium]|nr:copper resistance protein NlpE N-terminal domain-containing protein [Anaerolineales bacterium]